MLRFKGLFRVAFLAVVAAFVSSLTQAQVSKPAARKKPIPVHLDLETGTFTRGPTAGADGSFSYNTFTTFDHQVPSGAVADDLGTAGSGPVEWITAGTKMGGESQFVTSFGFDYCSAALDTTLGGPGGAVQVQFREGYTKGAANAGGPSGTVVASFVLTGLPANDVCSEFSGTYTCYDISVSLGNNLFVLRDTYIGWGWKFSDLGTDGVLAKTFPQLACVANCMGPGPDANGITDCIDRYDSAGTYLGTISFTNQGTPSLVIREAEAIASLSAIYNPTASGKPANPVRTTALTGPPALGLSWAIQTDCSGADPTKNVLWALSLAPAPFFVVGEGWRLVDVTPPFLVLTGFAPHFGGTATWGPVAIPADLQLYNACWWVQARCGDTSPFYTNALAQTVGSF